MLWHDKSADEALKHFGVSPEAGLSKEEVNKNREQYGSNDLLTSKPKPWWLLLFEQFNDPVIYILVAAAILTILVDHAKDSIVIAFVVVLNTLIGYFQERKAADALKALRKMAAPTARVIRGGKQKNIHTSKVVAGDIIVLESGVSVPADARLLEAHNLLVDESMLTGESFAIEKKPDAAISRNVPIGDKITMVFSGTIIQKGRGLAVVTGVGTNTEFGKISEKVAEAEETVSPLQLQIEKFSKGLSIAIVSIIALIFVFGFLRGNDIVTMLMTSVGLAVSAIPEGLPVSVTITLSIGVYQMAKHKAVVKKLAAVETLGGTNVICTDKTGTLTKNQMIVKKYFSGTREYSVTGSGYGVEGNVVDDADGKIVAHDHNKNMAVLSLISALCTESSISKKKDEWKITGDPTEAALMIAAHKLGFNRDEWTVRVDIPFESDYQLMAVHAEKGESKYVLVKGAPEKIIARCTGMLNGDSEPVDLDTELINSRLESFSREGLRVLALAYCKKCVDRPLNLDDLEQLTFAGFAGIEDSVRPEAAHAIKECHNAGVRVVMITGDHVKTARSVARSIGLAKDKESPEAVSGMELDEMDDNTLFDRVPDIDVYARVAPQHKFRIVKQLQKHDKTVAMTGDGVNDAPALKQADIGVAMGSGTDVAKESAHMILMDDNFATIVSAIRRGRVILHNLQHIILYILCTSFGGIVTIATSVALGFPLPVLPAQLLWINLVTDGTNTFPLAFEKEHGNVMVFSPSRKVKSLVSKEILYRIFVSGFIMMVGTLSVFYLSADDVFTATGYELARAQTMAFCVLAFFQIWNVQNSRSVDRSLFFNLPHPKMYDPRFAGKEKFEKADPMKNKILLAVMLLAILLQVSAVALPFMNILMDTVPLNLNEWLTVLAVSASIIVLVELAKIITAVITTQSYKRKAGIK